MKIIPQKHKKALYHTTGCVISLVTDFTQTLKPLINASQLVLEFSVFVVQDFLFHQVLFRWVDNIFVNIC